MKVAFIVPHSSESAYPEFIRTHNNPDGFDREIIVNHDGLSMKYCKACRMMGVEPVVYYFSQHAKKVKTFTHKYGHRVVRIPVKIGAGNFAKEKSFRLLVELRREGPDIIHFHGYYRDWLFPDMYDSFALFCKLTRQPFIAQYHTGGFPSISSKRLKILKKTLIFPKRVLKRTAMLFADRILTINELEKERLTNPSYPGYYGLYIKPQKVVWVPNIVDTNDFYPIPKEKAARMLGKNQDKHYLLYVGRLLYEKGIQNIINTMPDLLQEYHNIEFLIVGDGIYKEELQRLAVQQGVKGKICFTGFKPHNILNLYYNMADALVLSSHSESFSAVLIEALACNTPSTGTAVGGIPEVLSNGVGMIVPPKDEKALFDAIKKGLDGKFKINQTARRRKLQEYSLENVGKLLKEIYIEVLKERNKKII